jgi:thymidylate kinase
VKLDVVTELAFGDRQELVVPAAAAALERRRTDGALPSLDPDDAFWALLLHCVLDRGGLAPHHAARLLALAPSATADGPVAAALPAGVVADVIATVRRGDVQGVTRTSAALRRALWRRRPLATARRRARNAALRRATKLLLATRRRGASVALLGPDGAGKSTVSARLAESHWYPVRVLYAGLYGKGTSPLLLPGLAGRLLRLWSVVVRGWANRARGSVVVFDRYVYDARLPAPRPSRLLGRARRWIVGHAAPATDVVVLLDAPADVLFARKGEHDPAALAAQRAGYRTVVDGLPNGVVVDATRPTDDVVEDVIAAVWRAEARRRGVAS